MEEAAVKITRMFTKSVEAGNHRNAAACPVLASRLAVCESDPKVRRLEPRQAMPPPPAQLPPSPCR